MKLKNIDKVAILILVLFLPLVVYGQDPQKVAEEIAKYMGKAAIAIGMAFAAYGVYKIATSAGAPNALSEGIHWLIWGVVGIVIGGLLQSGGWKWW